MVGRCRHTFWYGRDLVFLPGMRGLMNFAEEPVRLEATWLILAVVRGREPAPSDVLVPLVQCTCRVDATVARRDSGWTPNLRIGSESGENVNGAAATMRSRMPRSTSNATNRTS